MHARVTFDPIQPGKMDEAMKVEQGSILRAAENEKGFQGLYFLLDRQSGKAMTISLWDSESSMKAAERDGYYREQIAKLMPLASGPVVKENYEVIAQGLPHER